MDMDTNTNYQYQYQYRYGYGYGHMDHGYGYRYRYTDTGYGYEYRYRYRYTGMGMGTGTDIDTGWTLGCTLTNLWLSLGRYGLLMGTDLGMANNTPGLPVQITWGEVFGKLTHNFVILAVFLLNVM